MHDFSISGPFQEHEFEIKNLEAVKYWLDSEKAFEWDGLRFFSLKRPSYIESRLRAENLINEANKRNLI
jgi:hypothetical protein